MGHKKIIITIIIFFKVIVFPEFAYDANHDPEDPNRYITALLGEGGLDTTHRWNYELPFGTPVTVTYSFPSTLPEQWNLPEIDTPLVFIALNEWQKQTVRDAMAEMHKVCGITFEEIANDGEMEIFGAPGCGGAATRPNPGLWTEILNQRAGYIRLGVGEGCITNWDIINHIPYALFRDLALHEIGHALGLAHPREFPDDTHPEPWSHSPVLLNNDEDTRQYTMMSNFSPPDPIPQWHQTPLLYDIAALQYLYGPNVNYNKNDSIYSFVELNAQRICVWDSGGIDTLDFSKFYSPITINLNTASFSTFGYIDLSEYAFEGPAIENLSIAWDTIIENVMGGRGNDIFYANDAPNFIDGGSGYDKVIYPGSENDYTITYNGDKILVTKQGTSNTDTLINIEEVLVDSKIFTPPVSSLLRLFMPAILSGSRSGQ